MNTISKKFIVSILIILSSLFTFTACSLGVRPEFKKAMDSYEEFVDEYCDFMTEYKESNNPTELLNDYVEYVDKLAKLTKDFNEIADEELNEAEIIYYEKVVSRTTKKLLNVG